MEKESRIRKLRREKDLSGIKVAEKLDITPQYYYDIEKGDRRLTAEIAGKLADVLETTVDYLLGKTDINLYDWLPEDYVDKLVKENPSSYAANEKEFIRKINLSDESLLKEFKIELDGRELSEQEQKNIIAFVRALRQDQKDNN